jgi:hypothetical protein
MLPGHRRVGVPAENETGDVRTTPETNFSRHFENRLLRPTFVEASEWH